MSIGSEASTASLGLSPAAGTNVTTDPQTGEIVGGLKGLRDLIRLKKESDRVSSSDGNASEPNPNVKTDRKDNKSEAFGIRANQIVYAETKRADGRIVDVLLYVIKDDGVIYTYTPQLFGEDKRSDFCRDINRLLRANNNLFDTARYEEMKMYIHKDMPIETGDTSLVYDNKYELASSSDTIYQEVKKKLTTPPTVKRNTDKKEKAGKESDAKKVHKDEAPIEESGQKAVAESSVNESTTDSGDKDNSGKTDEIISNDGKRAKQSVKNGKDDEGIVIKLDELRKSQPIKSETKKADAKKDETADTVKTVMDVHKIVTAANGDPSLRDVMQIILLLNKADDTVIKTLFGLDDASTAELFDSLRRMRALGERQADGSYQILLKSIKQLGHDTEYMLMSSADNFRAVVPKMPVRGRRLVYDLDELRSIQTAEEFVRSLVRFCEASHSHVIDGLFANSVERDIPVSRLLRVVSADTSNVAVDGYNTSDYELFNMYVTKYMISTGLMADDDGYPWFIFHLSGIDGLRNDILKYLMTNFAWIKAIYSDEVAESMLVNLQELDFSDCIVPEMEPLRDALCAMIAEGMKSDDISVDKSQLSLTDKDANTEIAATAEIDKTV